MANDKVTIPASEKDQAFGLYIIFLGDAVKTAHALGVPVATVVNVAREEGWDKRVGELAELRNSDKPGDLERAINRANNYSQAHRMFIQLERVLKLLQSWSDDELRRMLVKRVVDKQGRASECFDTRPLADITAAMEKAHTMSYLALNDTASDRKQRNESGDDSVIAASAMHAQIARTMAEISEHESPRTQLLEQQVKSANESAQSFSLVPPTCDSAEMTVIDIPPLDILDEKK
jgi:hypothetical protein